MILQLLFATKLVHSQDAAFSQFYSNPLYLNPALAGTNDCARLMFNYRINGPQLTTISPLIALQLIVILPAYQEAWA